MRSAALLARARASTELPRDERLAILKVLAQSPVDVAQKREAEVARTLLKTEGVPRALFVLQLSQDDAKIMERWSPEDLSWGCLRFRALLRVFVA